MRFRIELKGDGYSVYDTDETPTETNYHGLVARGFVSYDQAVFYVRKLELALSPSKDTDAMN